MGKGWQLNCGSSWLVYQQVSGEAGVRYPCWTNIQTKHEGSIKYKARPQVDGLLFRVGVVGVGGGDRSEGRPN